MVFSNSKFSCGVLVLTFIHMITAKTDINIKSKSLVKKTLETSQLTVDIFHDRYKRSTNEDVGQRACLVFIGIDEPLWDRHNNNMSEVVQLAQQHVDGLNDIFTSQIFNTSENEDRYFRLSRVQIMFGSCDGFEDKNCTQYRDKYLNSFDKSHDFSDFCLAYMFTYIDFHNDTAGLASIGTVCRKTHNSGFVTLLNNGEDTEFQQSSLTFAHEVGHNFGASHDDDFEDCKGQGFIMSAVATNNESTRSNRRNFSSCSIKSIREGIKNLTLEVNGVEDCFKQISRTESTPEVETSLCGNRIVEPGEACDCGSDPETCNDDCCYPAHISAHDRSLNVSAVFCQTNRKSSCLLPPPVIFAIYLPFGMIGLATLVLFLVLRRDWNGQKKLFSHLTKGQIRIVRPNP